MQGDRRRQADGRKEIDGETYGLRGSQMDGERGRQTETERQACGEIE